MTFLREFSRDESGATAIEYGIIVGILSLVVITALGSVAAQLGDLFRWIAGQMANIGA